MSAAKDIHPVDANQLYKWLFDGVLQYLVNGVWMDCYVVTMQHNPGEKPPMYHDFDQFRRKP